MRLNTLLVGPRWDVDMPVLRLRLPPKREEEIKNDSRLKLLIRTGVGGGTVTHLLALLTTCTPTQPRTGSDWK